MKRGDGAALPPGRRNVRFDQIAQCITERVNPAEAESEYYVGLQHLDPDSLKIRRWGKPSDVEGEKLRFHTGDVIYGRRRAYQRKVAVAEFDGICSAHAMVLRTREETMLQEFLPFFMQSETFHQRALAISVGSLSPTINWKTLAQQEFAVPPLAEQRRIAEILWAAEDVREKGIAVEKATIELRSSLIQDFLTHGLPGWHTEYKDTPIGLLPKSWSYLPCSQLFIERPRNGFSPQIAAMETGYPTLSISAIRDGEVIPTGNLKYADIPAGEAAKFRLYPGDLLVVRGNGNRDLVGRCGIVSDVPEGCFYPDLLIRIKFDPARIRAQFACIEWNAPLIHRKLITRAKSTSGIWKVNGQDLWQHRLVVPPIEEQEAFLRMMTSQTDALRHIREHVARTRGLRAHLVNALFDPTLRAAGET